jgi:hypothetical protein
MHVSVIVTGVGDNKMAYFAQQQMSAFVSELLEDVEAPEYCFVGRFSRVPLCAHLRRRSAHSNAQLMTPRTRSPASIIALRAWTRWIGVYFWEGFCVHLRFWLQTL